MVEVYSKNNNLIAALNGIKAKHKSIGLVPTMGALHQGHLALVKQALKECDSVVVSIFVNPTQFNNPNDLTTYPRTLDSDVALLNSLNNTNILVYAPSVNEVYSTSIKAENFSFDGLEFEMEGKFRAGHFNGVGTVVKRLFEIITPEKAYFGEKDFQQLQIVKKMVEKHNIPVHIINCPIYRESSGLAMSSRNTRLKPEYLEAAPFIYKILTEAHLKFRTISTQKITQWVEQQFKKQHLLSLEYFTIAEISTLKTVKRVSSHKKYRAFIAVYADDVRLIDNIALN